MDVKEKWFQVISVSLINFLPVDLCVILKLSLFESVNFFLDTTLSFTVNSGTLRDLFSVSVIFTGRENQLKDQIKIFIFALLQIWGEIFH